MSLHTTPHTDAEWARSVEQRLARLEAPRTIRMGPWVISVSPVSGDLIADHIPTGRRTSIAVSMPEERRKER